MTAVALRMTGADFLKLRKKRWTLIWVLVLALLPVIVLYTVKAIQHSSNPLKYEPAGGTAGFTDGLRLLCLFFGPLAAILIGVEAGTGDAWPVSSGTLSSPAARVWRCSRRVCRLLWPCAGRLRSPDTCSCC